MDGDFLQRIDKELAKLRLQRGICVSVEPHDNGLPNSQVKITGTVQTFYHRQIVDQAVLRLLPKAICLRSEIQVKG